MSTTQAERPTTLDHQALDDIFTAIAERAASSDKSEPVVESTPSRQSKQAPSFRAVQPRPREMPQAIPTDWFDVLSRTIMVGCVAAGMYLLLTGFSWSPLRKPRTESPVQIAVSQPNTKVVTEAIQEFDVGMRAAGSNPLRDQVETAPEPDPLTSRKLVLQLKKESGYRLTAKLLRSTAWMERAGVVDGGTFFLELPEMGAVGDAYVEAILPCPPITKGPGNVVTGVFEHEADPSTRILNVAFSNGEVIEGVTENHPFFSVDRNDFVPVGEMREGETVKIVDGLTQITDIKSRFAKVGELLYNLETHNEHVYQVSNAGIVVHNSCISDIRFGGARGIDSLRTATHHDITKAFSQSGFKPSSHFISRVKDIRAERLGLNTFDDLERMFRNGHIVDANDGLKALVHGDLAIIFNPKTNVLVTLTPW
jgi:hypothetical protein